MASELPMQSTPENSIVSFSADLDRLLGVGFPLGQVTELCALHFRMANSPRSTRS